MKYRPEIDGLRAVAVMPVIFFHAGLGLFSGGYIGVDIFFVISGYLITTIIVEDISLKKFSLAQFYERRARRILPALFFVIVVSIPFASFLLAGTSQLEFSQSIVSITLFVSNFFYWERSGYFETASELLPFLHTWSLAVEEQFYIFFPLLLIALWRFNLRTIVSILLILLLSSLSLSQWASTRYAAANFYLTPMRAWELLIGVLLSIALTFSKDGFRSNNPASLLGLGLIIFSIFSFDEKTPFPSIYALAPTVGAALIILFASKDTIAGKLLSRRGFVGIGLISYSAYLWHQPLLAFARLSDISPILSAWQIFALISASLALGWLSWRYIETPFRNKHRFSRKQIFSFAATGGVVLITLSFSAEMFPNSNAFGGVFEKIIPSSLDECSGIIPRDGECVIGADVIPTVAIIGDSHAMALANYFGPSLDKAGLSAVQIAKPGCIPIQKLIRTDGDGLCKSFNDDVFQYLVENKNITTVVVSARWTIALMRTRFDNLEGGVELGGNANYFPAGVDVEKLTDENVRDLLAVHIQQGIQGLLDIGKRVILVYPVPEVGWEPERVAFILTRIKGIPFEEIELSTSYSVFKERNSAAYAALDSVPPNPRLLRIFPETLFCNTKIQGRCLVAFDGKQYYRDDDHLGQAGAQLVIDQMMELLLRSR